MNTYTYYNPPHKSHLDTTNRVQLDNAVLQRIVPLLDAIEIYIKNKNYFLF